MSKKRSLCMFLAVCLSILMLCPITVLAVGTEIPSATSQFYVNDFADIIDEESEKEMQETAEALAEESDGIQVVVTTVQTVGDADPAEYTVHMYNEYGIGKNNMGVLILLSVETRDIQIRLGDNMTKYLSDRKAGEIRDVGIPYFQKDQFGKGLYEMQKATIKHITGKVKSTEDEVAVKVTDLEDISRESAVGKIFAVIAVIAGGVLSFFGVNAYLKKRKERKAKEERERIENSDLVKKKNQTIENLRAQLENEKQKADRAINERNKKISSLTGDLKSTESKLNMLKHRNEKAIIAYPDLEEKVDAILAKEKEEADKKRALEVEKNISNVLQLECTRQNRYQFESACNAFESLSSEQQKYVPANLVKKVRNLFEESVKLQRKFEEEERIRKNKAKAEEVQKVILTALACTVTRHSLSQLKDACRAYENLTNEQKKYVTADIRLLEERRRKAKRLQDEYEEEERRRRREEEERRRRREEEERRRRMMSSSSHSSFGGSHSGFRGHSSGHGAGGKF